MSSESLDCPSESSSKEVGQRITSKDTIVVMDYGSLELEMVAKLLASGEQIIVLENDNLTLLKRRVEEMSFLSELFDYVQKPVFSDMALAPWKRHWKRIHKDSSAVPVSRSKYKPHQGERECARRRRQGLVGK